MTGLGRKIDSWRGMISVNLFKIIAFFLRWYRYQFYILLKCLINHQNNRNRLVNGKRRKWEKNFKQSKVSQASGKKYRKNRKCSIRQ